MSNEDFDAAGNISQDALLATGDEAQLSQSVVAQNATEPAPVDAGTGQTLGNDPAAKPAVAQETTQIIVGEGNAVRLPEGVSIEKIKVDGRDLVLEQPDGSVIVIDNAALNIPTFWIGDIEIPQIALTAALEANGINVAAGPDGNLVAVPGDAESAGGNFVQPSPGIGDAGPILGLLPPTALEFGRLEEPELFPDFRNDFPDIDVGIVRDGVTLDTDQGRVDESALDTPTSVGSGGGSSTAEGIIDVAPGDDGIASVTVRNSAGVVVDITNGGTIQGVYGSLIITPDGDTGKFHFEYVLSTNTIDHANAGVTGVADPVFDNFVVTVTDGNGDTASDDFSILIGDDGPVAVSDINSVTEDGPLVATGSVMANDTEGADGASVTGIEAGLATTASGSVGSAVNGSYGTLTLQSNGTYVYALDNDARVQGLSAGEQLTDVFTYTLTDGDGDSSTTTLTITIRGVDDGVTITGLAVPGGELRLDEDDLADGSSPDESALTKSGSFTLSAVDGLDSITVGGVTVVSGGVFVGGTITTATGILTITSFTPVISAGEVVGGSVGYSYQLTDNTLTHGPGNNGENGGVFDNFTVVVTDEDGSSATASLDVEIIDDVPDASAVAGATASALLDESNVALGGDGDGLNPAVITGASIAGLFATPGFGADGAGSVGYTLAATNGAATGLFLTGNAQEILLVQVSATVFEGRAGGGVGQLAFTVSINAVTGQVTVTQAAPLAHAVDGPEGAAHDDALSLSGAAAIRVVQTVTDGDGDTDQATSANGLSISFEDDGPSLVATAVAANALVVDETVLGTNDTADFSGLFVPDYGADGAGTVGNYVLGVTAGATGLVDTATGEAVTLQVVGGVVQGVIGGGVVVFTVSVDAAGVVTLDQVRAVMQPTPGASHDEPVGLAAANLITLTATVTDRDGDTATATANIGGAISFEDDGPSLVATAAGANALVVDETVLGTNDTADFSGLFVPDYGADGAGTVGNYVLGVTAGATGLVDTATGEAVTLQVVGGVVQGVIGGGVVVFTVSVDAAGVVTLDQVRAVMQPTPGASHDEPVGLAAANLITLTATVTDRDGDTATATANIGGAISFEDDGPSLVATAAGANALVVDETVLGTNDTADFSGLFVPDYGADGAGTVGNYVLGVTAGATGLVDTATGEAVTLQVVGGVVQGVIGGGVVVFTVSVDAAGVVTLDQVRAVMQPTPGASHDEPVGLAAANLITLTATVTDRDGDTATATANIGGAISFEDDGPSLVATAAAANALVVDETVLGTNDTADFSGLFVPDYGADGAGTVGNYVLGVTAGATGLVDTATGEAVTLQVVGGVVQGVIGGGVVVFTVSVDAAGVVTLDQVRAVMQPTPGASHDEPVGLAAANLITLTATVTDRDGDTATATANIGGAISFEDDGPSLVATAAGANALVVDETVLGTNDTADFSGLFVPDYGADGAGTVGNYVLGVTAGATGLVDTATGEAVTLQVVGGVVQGVIGGGVVVFTVSVDAAGVVTLDQVRAVMQPTPGASHDEPVGLAAANLITLTATVTDRDGDTATATANIGGAISFEDDGPSLVATAAGANALVVDETVLGTNDTADFSGLFVPDYGADGAGTVGNYVLGVTAGATGLVDTATGEAVTLQVVGGVVQGVIGGGVVVFTVSVDAAGVVTLDQVRAVMQPTPGASHDEPVGLAAANLITLTATVTDRDGDTATATANIGGAISFEDDGPSLVATAAAANALVVDETVLGTNDTADFSGLFVPDYGADGAGTVGNYVLGVTAGATGLVDTATGEAVTLQVVGGVVQGVIGGGVVVFTVSVDAAGVVTLDQVRAVMQPTPGASHDEPVGLAAANLITLTATVTDRDGDTATATANIGGAISFEDDGPSLVATAAGANALVVDETVLGTNDTADFSGLFVPDYGADGAGTVGNYVLGVTAGATGLVDTATGEAVTLQVVGGVVQGVIGGGVVVFTVSVDAAGVVTLDQVRAVMQPTPGASHDEPVGLAAANLITLTATVTDRDGDTATATANIGGAISFEDDGPSLVATAAGANALVVDETVLGTNDTADFSGLFVPDYGADGAGTVGNYVLGVTAGATGLVDTATGEAVTLQVVGGVVQGVIGGGVVVFTVSVDAAGVVTLDQVRAVMQPTPGASHDEPVGLAAANLITLTATVTDRDGDTATATANIGGAISFEDDGPSLVATAAGANALVVDETVLGTNDTADFSGLFVPDYGADGAGTVGNYVLGVTAGATGLVDTATGEAVTLQVVGGVVQGVIGGGVVVFTVSVDAAGVVTLDQVRAVMQPTPGASHDEPVGLAAANLITLTATVTDRDGDTATATANIGGAISFEDDGPIQVGAPLVGEVEEDALDNFDPLYPVGDDIEGSKGNKESNQTQLLVATFTFAMLSALVDAGADGLADIKLNLPGIDGTTVLTAGNAAVTSKGEAVVYNVNGGVIEGVSSVDGRIVFKITIDGNGDVSFTLIDQLDHLPLNAAGGDAEAIDIDISGAIVAVDGDGDELVFQDTVTVRVENDIPIAFIPEHAYVTNVDGAALTFQLNFDEAVGADESGSVKFVNVVSGVTELTDASGNPVTSGGKDITLELDASGTVLTGYIDYGLPTETLVLTVSINPDDTYTINLDVPLDDGFSETTFNPFDDGQSPGNRLFNEVNDLAIGGSPVLLDVLLSGTDDNGALDSVNVSSSGSGVGSQGITEDVTLRLDFAEEFVRSSIGSSTGSFTVNNTHLLESVAVGIAQTNPNGQQAVAFLEALTTNFSFSGGQFNHNQAGDVTNFLTETSVAIAAIVLNGTEYDVASFANGANLDASHQIYYVMSGADVIGAYVTGLVPGDTVGLTTSDGFSRFAITNGENDPRPGGGVFAGGSFANSFDIGDVTFRTEGQAGEPIDLSLDVQGTDFDGDTVTSTLDFTVVPNDANNVVGTSGADLALTGTTGDDLIAGLAGNDTLSGDDGDDILAGGLGSDTMEGGAGADTFAVGIDSLGAGINDLILDYNDAQGDVVDLSALLDSLSGAPTTAAEANAVVNLVAGVGSTSIMVDDNGTAAGGNVTEVATLSGTHTVVAILFDDAQLPTDVA